MDQSLLVARGAQPVKPSRYKPIWTDRFFTGYFTNRSPFRSPLSAFYADGWQLGKTDTLINGANVELSPRLTLIRRPGLTNFNAAQTIPQAPTSFYSFHAEDGQIHLVLDTPASVYTFTSSTLTNLVNKAPTAGQSTFYGIGTTLYWGDGANTYAFNFADNTGRNMGIKAPVNAPTYTIANTAGSAATVHGAQFDGATTYISTSQQQTLFDGTNPAVDTLEFWVNTSASGVAPFASFESHQTGASPTTFRIAWLNAGILQYTVWDATAGAFNTINTGVKINDGKWHQIAIQTSYTPSVINAYSLGNGSYNYNYTTGSYGYGPDPSIDAPFFYNNTPSVSYSQTPSTLQINVYVDGNLIGTFTPAFGAPAVETGYWRFGNSTGTGTGVYLSGIMAYIARGNGVIGGQDARYANLIYGGTSQLVSSVGAPFQNFWQLQETSGTGVSDSIGSNAGTYNGTFTLNQSHQIVYVTWSASASFSLGQTVVDTNGNLQTVTTAGTSGSSAPAWLKNINQVTPDNTVRWTNQGPASITLNTPAGAKYCFCYVNAYGHFSTASPLSTSTGPHTGVQITVSGYGSPDAQVKNVAIFRTADGGSTPFYVGSIANPGSGATWTYTDTTADGELNILMAAPQAHSNDAPPTGAVCFTYHMGRMWCAVGGVLYASGGPDTLVGDGNEAWPPANSWTFPANIKRLVSTTSGLFVFTTSGVHILAGGPAIPQFYPQEMLPKIGISSYNAVDYNGSRIVFFTTDRQLVSIDTSVGMVDLGFPIGDKLAQLNPANVYVVEHHSGLDNAIYIADGSTGWYRCSPQQPPDYQITGPVWSPKATVNGGACGAIASVETSSGVWQLLVGSSAGGAHVMARDSGYGTFTDVGTSYDAFFTIGNVMLASPGEMAEISFITADFIKIGSQPTVSVLLDEIAGTFTTISVGVVSDPPKLYGPTGQPSSLYANRYYFRNATTPAYCRHMQLKVDFGNDTVMNEILSTTLYGTVLVENS